MGHLFIGLISGTSMDGIDAALVEFGDHTISVLQTREHPYPADVREQLPVAMHAPDVRTAADVSDLHTRIGECFRDAAIALLDDAGFDASAVTAIGSHGQTVRHQPEGNDPFSLQVGDPAIIAAGSGITTIADFRSADIRLGGQGAPLAPAFHEWLFRSAGTARAVVNIGGISNVTILHPDERPTIGFDTGPGNTLLDAWIRRHRDLAFDRDGAWSASGSVDALLLQRLLADPYFAKAPPKSTGFEYFNLDWLDSHEPGTLKPADVQATLCALTAKSVADAITDSAAGDSEVLVCGGGARNSDLMRRLAAELPAGTVSTTAVAGLDPDWVEAVAFAWLAMRHLENASGNLPSVTGAREAAVLGELFAPG